MPGKRNTFAGPPEHVASRESIPEIQEDHHGYLPELVQNNPAFGERFRFSMMLAPLQTDYMPVVLKTTAITLLSSAPLAYAEIHYRFRYFFSLLFRRRPEIVADLPPRIEAGGFFPLVITVKDASSRPVRIDEVEVRILNRKSGKFDSLTIETDRLEIREKFREVILSLTPEENPGDIEVTVFIRGEYLKTGKRFTILNDNYPGGFREAFHIHVAKSPLPSIPGWMCGDVHCHSNYTEDQVEFGAGLRGFYVMAAAVGLSWVGITDHSYDMDDKPGNYLENDPALEKWKMFLAETDSINTSSSFREFPDFRADPSVQRASETGPGHGPGSENENRNRVILVPGEELSCGSSDGKNIHLLILGNKNFIPGFGDGAEKLLRNRPTIPLEEALEKVESEPLPTACLAAHPFASIMFPERIIFNRGKWSEKDLYTRGLHGLQLWNSEETLEPEAAEGLERWRSMLLSGKMLPIAAGSDSHGNFGAVRAVTVPFVRIGTSRISRWARIRTFVKAKPEDGPEGIIRGLIRGATVVTSGPAANLQVSVKTWGTRGMENADGAGNNPAGPGDAVVLFLPDKDILTVKLTIYSSAEFGRIAGGNIILGIIGEAKERTIAKLENTSPSEDSHDPFTATVSTEVSGILPDGFGADVLSSGKNIDDVLAYIRAEGWSIMEEKVFRFWTSPVRLVYHGGKLQDQTDRTAVHHSSGRENPVIS